MLRRWTDVHLPLNLNIQAFRGEQLRLTGDTDITVYNLLLKVSSIDGQMKLDALDIDSDQGKVSASGSAQLQDNWPVGHYPRRNPETVDPDEKGRRCS
ncbi:Uncharacterised protein [Klebsiella pneumoniae]|uniref:AsmA protein n=1 Tax=Klebsiella pneumoniae TaxID=573 RepID=A0A377TM38_KLEPN|nr:Uncharacterised protein [Klebsiella pneumoniae]